MLLPVLYGITPRGTKIQWQIEYEDGKFRTHHGKYKGKIVTSKWTVCKGKNIGKKNATSASEQAELEAKAKFAHKCEREEFSRSLSAASRRKRFFKPMLAENYRDCHDTVTFPCIVQPKLEGIRSTITKAEATVTRKGTKVVSVPHLEKSLAETFEAVAGFRPDGELYNHDLRDDFEKITSLVRKTKPTKEDLEESERIIQLWVYDIASSDGTAEQRQQELDQLFATVLNGNKHIVRCPTYICNNQEELDKYYKEFRDAGFEGQIIRSMEGKYHNYRTVELLKRKEFQDKEWVILGYVEGKGNRSGTVGKLLFMTEDKYPFEANVKGTHEYLRKLWKDRHNLVGKLATIRFHRFTKYGAPKIGPGVIAIRDYE